jgi:hypothetical protein
MPDKIHQMNSSPSHPPRVFALAILNSSLDDSEIVPYLDGLKAAGYEGLCLHPRDGLRVPYASRIYWKRMDHIIHLARARGLAIWQYDEYPFPSGMAGGSIPADDPSCIVRSLKFETLDLRPNRDGLIEVGAQGLLALLRYREDAAGRKHDVRDVTADCGAYLDTWVWGEWHNKLYTGALHVHEELHERAVTDRYTRAYSSEEPLQPNEKLLAVKIVPAPFRCDLPGRPDVTRPEVTERFLEQIYSRFVELSQSQGLENVPVFQDEVSFGAAWPWNAEIEKRLRPLWGERFAEKLAGLHAPDVAGWEAARFEYRTATSDAFEQNWFGRVAEYCHAHDLQMTGHLAGEESIIAHCELMGNAFKNLALFDIPGFDIISSTIPDGINRSSELGIKVVQSAAWCAGRKPMMVEVFGAHGMHSDLQRQRNVLAWLGVHDMTTVFDHSTYLSSKSVRKYDAPPLSTRFNPLQTGRADLWEWHNWFADLMEEYAFDPQTLVLFPFESLARYCTAETEQWRAEVSLLETWFHTLFAHSLDAMLLPSHRLHEVEATADGFVFDGHTFRNFIVPPFASLHEDVWQRVLPLAERAGFAWYTPRDQSEVKVFNASGDAKHALPTTKIFHSDEAELLEMQAAYFDGVLASPLAAFASDTTILKTRRRNASGETLHVIINPHDEAIRIRTCGELGAPLAQPHTGASEYSSGDERMLAPREVLILKQSTSAHTALDTVLLPPDQSQLRFVAPNHLKLQTGRIRLEGYTEKDFIPAPISSLWALRGQEHLVSDPMIALPYGREKLPCPLSLEATFPLTLVEALGALQILLDDESAPDELEVRWDGVRLMPQRADVYDQANTVYSIPAETLAIGAHVLTIQGVASNGAQGILERPILIGDFLAEDLQPRRTPRLRALPKAAQNWQGENWSQLGMPEGFGPVDYDFVFTLDENQAQQAWKLLLSLDTGVAEVFLEESLQGRSSWEPRCVPMSTLRRGKNRVRVRVHGSWNNVFSRLNRVENGLTALPRLRLVPSV